VALYAAFRFFIEFVRGDAGGIHIGPLTFAQATSTLVLLAALALMWWLFRIEAEPA
jgi:prolipoprotein diacylglyceryltransferase